MAATVRLPQELQAEAMAYAERLGLSLNGLIAVALRDYLDERRKHPRQAAQVMPEPSEDDAGDAADPTETQDQRPQGKPLAEATKPAHRAVAVPRAAPAIRPPANRRAPCPCGSGKRYSQCHGLSQAAAGV